MSRKSRKGPRNAVYIVVTEESFRPTRPWHLPQNLTAAELLTKNVSWQRAAAFARVFNKAQLERGLADRRWAVAVGHTKYRWQPEVPDQAAKIQGADADLARQLEEKGGDQ